MSREDCMQSRFYVTWNFLIRNKYSSSISSALLNDTAYTLRHIEQFLGINQGLAPSIEAHVGVKTEGNFAEELKVLRNYYRPYNEELKGLLKDEFDLTMSWLEEGA